MSAVTPYVIRAAEAADLSCLAEIERAADTLFPEGRLPADDATYPLDGLKTALEKQLLLVAESADALVGFAVCREADHALHLDLLAVHPAHGRRGLGSGLVRQVNQISRARGLIGTTLTTFSDIAWNAPFYSRLGFRILPPEEQSPMLKSILLREADAGMQSRVAMFHDLAC